MISTLSFSSPVRLSVQQAQASLARAQAELSSGIKADLGASLGAATGRSLSLRNEIDSLNAFANTNALASTRLSATSGALGAMLSAAQSMSASLVTASSTGGSTATLQVSAQSALASLVGELNTSAGGQFVFSGLETDQAPMTSYETGSANKQAVDAAFEANFGTSQSGSAASSITGVQMQSFLNTKFAGLFADSGWQANWSAASSDTTESNISPSQSLTTSVSANSTPFRQITQAYTMLSEFAGQNLSSEARAAVISTASTLVHTAIAGLTAEQSAVGIAQSTISDAGTRIKDQVNVLQTSVDDLDGVDPYVLSTRITQLQTQLQASYELTSRLSQLSLVNYLNG